ncbi:chloride channel protein [Reticulibacter mediterranei]|uniref:Chloride channel protein n=1 Tax=Reticulibacter mediterranei TaxID=2778369 RepID=A0A8J3IW38_9CHLR|nr:chloride channel protein [Reticulibacter mediterranei]GHO97875.1 chloride channel protein [Reticulibacter mediterranei]
MAKADISHSEDNARKLGDFTATPRMLVLSVAALGIGIVSAVVALILLKLIGLCTNLFFYQRWSTEMVSPAGNHLGLLAVLVPVVGGLIIGLMARYGSERIRGHGIPEAIEAILINGSKVEPKVALLKPLSSAISIGSGGPFGAEGPIIMTGGAVGSMLAQFFHLTSAERKILLVAGAAGGMSATFGSPVAAVLLAAELLLFEWKPRSLVPVSLSSVAAYGLRNYIIGQGALFPVPAHPLVIDPVGLLSCVLVGVLAGLLSALLTQAVYFFEDSFGKLPMHWMWWPAVGGLIIGIGGLFFPQALGVGYDTIGQMLQGNVTTGVILGVLLVKSIIWSASLGSGTSGGVLAPLLMMGCALGGIDALFLPHEGAGFWILISMGAILGGTMRVPFTGVVFALELTHDFNSVVPLFIAVMASYGFTVLVMRRSILTEKIARRGYHLSREYATDPLEILFVREVMRTNIAALPASISRQRVREMLNDGARSLKAQGKDDELNGSKLPVVQRLYPVLDEQEHMVGVVTRRDLQHLAENSPDGDWQLGEVIRHDPITTYPDEPLRLVVYRMAETGYTRLPVVDVEGNLVGIVSLNDLLKARSRNLDEERRRERVLRLHMLLPLGRRSVREETIA